MTTLRTTIAATWLAASLCGGAAPAIAAAPEAPPAADAGGPERGMHRPHDGFGGHGPGGPGPDMPFLPHGGPGLHRLHLTEAQQDKVFALEHAAEPGRREQDKAIRKAHETLRELGRTDRFDEARAAAAARDLGQAVGARSLAEARLHAQVLAVLTPEQREELRQGPMRRERPGAGRPGGAEQGGAPAR